LAQPGGVPERSVGTNTRVLFDHMLDHWSSDPAAISADVRAEYFRSFRLPETLHAICEEYRASITHDYQSDAADRNRRRTQCPVLALWSGRSAFHRTYDVLAVWREWADDVRGRALDCGHFLPEEAPDQTWDELRRFLMS
jgi:haloacetate dehalogenase